MIAALPMYARPENRAAHAAFWSAIRSALATRGIGAPEALDTDIAPQDAWRHPDLLLSQICNLPYRQSFSESVTLVAAPDHGLPDAPAGTYYSVIVAHAEDPRGDLAAFDGARIAVNSADSQSGWGAPSAAASRLGIAFGHAIATGAHVESARTVAERRADVAAIDAATWRMIRRWDRFAANLRQIGRTPPTPALAYVTGRGRDPAPIRAALSDAIAGLSEDMREKLGVRAILPPDPEGYDALPVPPAPPF